MTAILTVLALASYTTICVGLATNSAGALMYFMIQRNAMRKNYDILNVADTELLTV
jgi:hypothetical protein